MPDIFDQLAAQPQTPPPPLPSAPPPQVQKQGGGDIFDQMAQGSYKEPQLPQQEPQADTFDRIYQTSPIKSTVEQAKSVWDSSRQKVQEDQEAGKQVIDLVKNGDYGRAAEALLFHLAKRGGQAIESMPGVSAVEGIAKSTASHGKKAIEAAKKGDVGETIAQEAEAVPVFGQLAEQIGEPLGKDVKEGNYAGAAGDVIGGATSILPLLVGGKSKAAETEAAEPGLLRPGTTEIAGEKIPIRASAQKGIKGSVASKAEYGAASSDLKKFDVEKTQPAARKAVSNVASKAAETGKTAAVPPKEDAFGFGQAHDELQARAKPVFQKLDELSGNEFTQLQRKQRQAVAAKDFNAAEDFKLQQEQLFDTYADDFAPDTLARAKADWRQSMGMDALKNRFNRTVHPTPVELTKSGETDIGYVNGKMFRESITDALQKDKFGMNEFERAGFSPEHVQTIEDIGRLLEKGNNYHKLNPMMRLLARGSVGIAGFLGHPLEAGMILGGEYLVGKVLGRIMTNPEASSVLLKGLKSGVSVPAIANALRPLIVPAKDNKETKKDQE